MHPRQRKGQARIVGRARNGTVRGATSPIDRVAPSALATTMGIATEHAPRPCSMCAKSAWPHIRQRLAGRELRPDRAHPPPPLVSGRRPRVEHQIPAQHPLKPRTKEILLRGVSTRTGSLEQSWSETKPIAVEQSWSGTKLTATSETKKPPATPERPRTKPASVVCDIREKQCPQ